MPEPRFETVEERRSRPGMICREFLVDVLLVPVEDEVEGMEEGCSAESDDDGGGAGGGCGGGGIAGYVAPTGDGPGDGLLIGVFPLEPTLELPVLFEPEPDALPCKGVFGTFRLVFLGGLFCLVELDELECVPFVKRRDILAVAVLVVGSTTLGTGLNNFGG
jgi:hypothetical protein